jgi:hypothetical protein
MCYWQGIDNELDDVSWCEILAEVTPEETGHEGFKCAALAVQVRIAEVRPCQGNRV